MLKERYEDYTEQEFLAVCEGKHYGCVCSGQRGKADTGRSFSSFDSFRRAFWKEVAKDEGLVNGLSPENLRSLEKASRLGSEQRNALVNGFLTNFITSSKSAKADPCMTWKTWKF